LEEIECNIRPNGFLGNALEFEVEAQYRPRKSLNVPLSSTKLESLGGEDMKNGKSVFDIN